MEKGKQKTENWLFFSKRIFIFRGRGEKVIHPHKDKYSIYGMCWFFEVSEVVIMDMQQEHQYCLEVLQCAFANKIKTVTKFL